MASNSNLLAVWILTCVLYAMTDGEKVAMKIVEEPSNYGLMHNIQAGNSGPTDEHKLHLRIKPSNFSGPHLFRRLIGKCFSITDNSYKYELCPFSNVTQHEQSLRWNPYSGVLGVWQEWEIVNNTFVAMVMIEGDKCGDRQRSAKVRFACGKENRLVNVSEPSTCNYLLLLETPYTCHPQAMLVYPTLPPQLQTEWDLLEGQLASGYITQKGYNKYLARIFAKAGYYLSENARKKLSEEAVQNELAKEKERAGDFDSLYQCKEEYQKLKKEIDGLKALLELNNQEHHEEQEENHFDEDYPAISMH